MATTGHAGTRSRRALLKAAAGGAAAMSAAMLARAAPAAAEGEPIVVGGRYVTARTPTYILNERNDRPVLVAESTVDGGVAVEGDSRAGAGVLGWSGGGDAVRGESDDGVAVSAWSGGGYSVSAGTAAGTAVSASAEGGVGVMSWASGGAGIVSFGFGGYSLVCAGGRVVFYNTSGLEVIPAGETALLVSPFVGPTQDSFVLLTAAVDIGARRLWYTLDTERGEFTIHMSSARRRPTPVGWMMLEHGHLAPMAASDAGVPSHWRSCSRGHVPSVGACVGVKHAAARAERGGRLIHGKEGSR